MINVLNLLTIYQLLQSAPNGIIHRIRSGEFGGQFGQKIFRQKIEDVDHLKQVLNRCWSMLSQELINCAIDQWSKRL